MNLFALVFGPVQFCTLSIWPAIIAGAAALGGSLLSSKGSESAADASLASRNLELLQQQNMHLDNIALQKEFAQHGVRWRVADAKAAGLHPLYGLNANIATYSPTVSAGVAPAESDRSWEHIGAGVSEAGRAIAQGLESQYSTRLQDAQVRLMEAQANRAEVESMAAAADLARSANSDPFWATYPAATDALLGLDRYMGDYTPRDRHYVGPGGSVPSGVPREGAIKISPSSDVSRLPGSAYLEAARPPALKEYDFPWGPLLLPGKEASESLESIEPLGAAAIVVSNVMHYGWRALKGLWYWADSLGGSQGEIVKGEIRKLQRRQ